MPPALWGAVTAFGWGCGDFLSHFTGGRLGVMSTLGGMMASGFVLLASYALLIDMPLALPQASDGAWTALVGAAVGIVAGTLLLFCGMVRGPISVVAPIVAAYPIWILAAAAVEGLELAAHHWGAAAAVLLGVVVVARLGGLAAPAGEAAPGGFLATLGIALLGSLCFASGIGSMQAAGPAFGELRVLLAVRLFGVATVAFALLAVPRLRRPIPWRWWPLLGLQGLLDGAADLALLIGSRDLEAAPTVVVAASTFGIVPVLLACIVLRERIAPAQWLAVSAIVAGVAVLSVS